MFVSYIESITELDHLFKTNSKGKKYISCSKELKFK